MIVVYNGLFSGFLSAVYEIYYLKIIPENITPIVKEAGLFSKIIVTDHDAIKSIKVMKAIKKKVSNSFYILIEVIFNSQKTGIEMLLYQLIQKILKSTSSIELNYSDPIVREVLKIERQFYKEVHRMHAFVRFEKHKDVFLATITPDLNMIPFIGKFFADRFSDQEWAIIDLNRKVGLYYNKQNLSYLKSDMLTEFMVMKQNKIQQEFNIVDQWKTYFNSVNIKERENLQLQRNHMPQRYWKYLPEMGDEKL